MKKASPDKNNGNLNTKRLEAILNDNQISAEEKVKKIIVDVPTNFKDLSGNK
jgi:hypothetical protein